MYTKQFSALAVASLATGALAYNTHRHAHQHFHKNNKKDVVYKHTDVVVFTEWVTVTVYDDELPTSSASVFKGVAPTTSSFSSSTSSSSSSSSTTSTSSVQPSPPPPPPPATTSASSVAEKETVAPPPPPPPAATVEQVQKQEPKPSPKPEPSTQAPAPAPAATKAATQPPPSTGGSSGGSAPSGGNKRGLAYNDAKLLPPFMGSGTKCTWAYNWGQRPDGLNVDVEYVPMLWGPIDMHTKTWTANAEAAIAGGAKNLLSFNECDNKGQCNLDPASAAREHIRLMNQYSGRVRISSPAITNSNLAGEGTRWLQAWVDACAGNCAFDFCAAHWYSPPDPTDFLGHLEEVHKICQGKPVWVTEFAPISGDASAFLATVMKELDTNPKYAFVERYSVFMVAQGKTLTSPNTLNALGSTFAYA